MWLRLQQSWVILQEQYAAVRDAVAPVRLTKSELFFLSLRKLRHDLLGLFDMKRNRQEMPPASMYAVIAVILGLTIAFVIDKIYQKRSSLRRIGLPVLQRPKGAHVYDYKAILDEGARKYPNSPYIITYSGFEYVVFPESSWDEIKRIPVTKASTLEWFTHVFFQGWRLLGSDTSAIHKAIGIDLTRAIPTRVHARQESARYACDAALGPCSDWTPFRMYWTLQSIVATTNATGLVGPELGTNRRWLIAVQAFPMAIVLGISVSSWSPRLLRPIVALFAFSPAWFLYWCMMILLRPMVKQDLQEYQTATSEEAKKQLLQATPNRKFPITGWLLLRYQPHEQTPQQVAHDYIVASFESTAATSATLYFIVTELVTRPELVAELREEISDAMVDGRLPQTQLGELRKLDSVMRECSRTNPFGYMALYRRLLEPVKLSIGPELPSGSLVCVDIHKVPTSETRWSDPATFDPMRFLKLRQQPGHETQHQFVSLGSDTPGWGDGPQACPGRAFAGNTLKITLAHLLMNYDFRLPPGGPKPKRKSMPNGSMSPDMLVRIMFRERKNRAKAE